MTSETSARIDATPSSVMSESDGMILAVVVSLMIEEDVDVVGGVGGGS